MTEYVDSAATEAARKQYEFDKQVSDRIRADAAERLGKGRPTPTQEEADMAMLGAPILMHDDDGSGPDPNTRAMDAGRGGGYQTRQTTAAPQHRAAAPQHRPSPARAE
jgi:hypothetical protein